MSARVRPGRGTLKAPSARGSLLSRAPRRHGASSQDTSCSIPRDRSRPCHHEGDAPASQETYRHLASDGARPRRDAIMRRSPPTPGSRPHRSSLNGGRPGDRGIDINPPHVPLGGQGFLCSMARRTTAAGQPRSPGQGTESFTSTAPSRPQTPGAPLVSQGEHRLETSQWSGLTGSAGEYEGVSVIMRRSRVAARRQALAHQTVHVRRTKSARPSRCRNHPQPSDWGGPSGTGRRWRIELQPPSARCQARLPRTRPPASSKQVHLPEGDAAGIHRRTYGAQPAQPPPRPAGKTSHLLQHPSRSDAVSDSLQKPSFRLRAARPQILPAGAAP